MNYINSHCYKLEKIIYNNAIFNDSIDATYILHLENNGRLNDIKNQLKNFKPTNTLYIVYNKGFKNCQKELPIYNSNYDFIDTVLFIFNDANNKKYQHILILEDDFMFSNEIYNGNHIENINNFLIEKKDEKMFYFLGCLSWLQLPYNAHTNINVLSSGTHAVIYSYKARKELLKTKISTIADLDVYHNLFAGIRKYIYYKPLCYQLFPETENSKNWMPFFGDFNKIYMKSYNLDIKVEPGYSDSYYYSLIFGYILIVIFIILVIIIIYYIINLNNSYIKNKKINKKLYK